MQNWPKPVTYGHYSVANAPSYKESFMNAVIAVLSHCAYIYIYIYIYIYTHSKSPTNVLLLLNFRILPSSIIQSCVCTKGKLWPIMLKILPIMLLSSAQKIAHYAQYYAKKY